MTRITVPGRPVPLERVIWVEVALNNACKMIVDLTGECPHTCCFGNVNKLNCGEECGVREEWQCWKEYFMEKKRGDGI